MSDSDKWPRAPLVFVLIAVKISQYPKLENHLADLHEAVLSKLPERQNSQTISVSFTAQGQPPTVEPKPVTRLFNPEDGLSMFVRDDLLALEITQYNGFAWARAVIREILEAAIRTLPSLRPQLAAMRYIDAILETPTEVIDKFVSPGLLGIGDKPGRLGSLQSSQQFIVGQDQTLTVSFVRASKPENVVPMPDGLELPQMLRPDSKLESFRAHAGAFGLLDFDASVKCSGAANLDNLMDSFDRLHVSVRDALPLCVTPVALSYWKGKD